jgi:hypothetical protein
MLLAKQTANQESKQTFLGLAQSWTRLAVELEDAQALLNALSEMEFKDAPAETDRDEEVLQAPSLPAPKGRRPRVARAI